MSDGAQILLLLLAVIACVKLSALRNEMKRVADVLERADKRVAGVRQ